MNKFERFLLTACFIELFVGGGGRFLEVGPFSLRQIIFILILVTYGLRIIFTKGLLDPKINKFISFNIGSIGIYLLLFWCLVSSVIGLAHGNAFSTIFTDFFRISYLLMYFPIAYYFTEGFMKKELIFRILLWSGLAVAILTVSIDICGKFIFKDNFLDFYNFINNVFSNDMFFRPSRGVFYKSHLYVLFAVLISIQSIYRKKAGFLEAAMVLLGLVSIVFSETRGLIYALMFGVVALTIVDFVHVSRFVKGVANKAKVLGSKEFVPKLVICVSLVFLTPYLSKSMVMARFTEDTKQVTPSQHNQDKEDPVERDESTNYRVMLLQESRDIVTSSPATFMFGAGYGTKIGPAEQVIEISGVDILVEQGLIGLGIWIFVCLIIYINYFKIYRLGAELTDIDCSIIACMTAIGFLTNVNPFINNPIGIGFLVFAIVCSQVRLNEVRQSLPQ